MADRVKDVVTADDVTADVVTADDVGEYVTTEEVQRRRDNVENAARNASETVMADASRFASELLANAKKRVEGHDQEIKNKDSERQARIDQEDLERQERFKKEDEARQIDLLKMGKEYISQLSKKEIYDNDTPEITSPEYMESNHVNNDYVEPLHKEPAHPSQPIYIGESNVSHKYNPYVLSDPGLWYKSTKSSMCRSINNKCGICPTVVQDTYLPIGDMFKK